MSSKPEPPDPQSMMRDWMTLWQSEVAAMGADREMQEGWARIAEAWARATSPKPPETGEQGDAAPGAAARDPAGGARTHVAPRSKTAADASDAEPGISGELAALRAEIARLSQRIDRLEASGTKSGKKRAPRASRA